MSKNCVNRRQLLKFGGVAALGIAISSTQSSRVFGQSARMDDLARRYALKPSDETELKTLQSEYAALNADELSVFNTAFAQVIIQLGSPHDPNTSQQVQEGLTTRNEMLRLSVKEYGVPFNKLNPSEQMGLSSRMRKQPINTTGITGFSDAVRSKGKGLNKPANQGWPCFHYPRSAWRNPAGLWFPNYSSYLQAAGVPSCGDPDLEVRYSGYRNMVYGSTAPGIAYITALISTGRNAVCRDFSGQTGMLVAGGALWMFAGSWWYAAYSLAMVTV